MSVHHLSVRLPDDIYARLEAQSRQTGQPPSELARILLDEGLRMEAHPGIVFRSGPAGRRPGLSDGPDVWEVVRVLRELEAAGEESVQQTAELTGLTPEQVERARRYYAGYRDQIDAWIKRVDVEAEQAETAWHHAQATRGR